MIAPNTQKQEYEEPEDLTYMRLLAGEDGSRYAVTLEDADTLALKFYLDGEESYMSLVSTVYFARQEGMG